MKDIYKILIIILAICGIVFVAYSSFWVVEDTNTLLTYGDEFSNQSTNTSIQLKDDVSASERVNITKGVYKLLIDSDAKWKVKYDIDGKSSQKEGNGSTNISLGTISSNGKIDFNQISKGSTSLEIYDSNNKFISSIYQAGKTVNLTYDLIVV